MTGQFWSTWTADDIEFFRSRFTDGIDSWIEFRIAVYIGGSEDQGATTPLDDLVYTEFIIKFTDPTALMSCADNMLYPMY